jgi:hypothetical protein
MGMRSEEQESPTFNAIRAFPDRGLDQNIRFLVSSENLPVRVPILPDA